MKMRIFAVLVCAAISSSAMAITPQVLISVGDVIGGATVSEIDAVAANQVGGYAAMVTDTTSGDLDYAVGTADGILPLSIKAQEGLVDGQTITSISTLSLGFSDAGEAVYDASAGTTDLLYRGSTLLLSEGSATSVGGTYNNISRVQSTSSGAAQFVSSISGGTITGGLFADDGSTFRYGVGSALDLPSPAVSISADFDHAVSPDGSHWINRVGTSGLPVFTTDFVVMDGSVIVLDGVRVRSENVVPVSIGGDGVEKWDNFDYFGVSDNGDYLFTGDTTGATSADEFLVVNGNMVAREGGTLDGITLNGTIRDAEMGANGDWAVIWADDTGADVLFVNGEAVVRIGDLASNGLAINDIENGNDHLAIGSNPDGSFTVYFRGDTDGTATVMAVTIPEPTTMVLVAVSGVAMMLKRRRRA